MEYTYQDIARIYGCETPKALLEVIDDLQNKLVQSEARIKELEQELTNYREDEKGYTEND